MKIRPSQIQTFEERAEQQQTLSIARILRRDIPDSLPDVPEEVLHGRIRYARQKGTEFLRGSVASEPGGQALMLWIRLMFEIGPDFMEHPVCRQVLSERAEPPGNRVMRLLLKSSNIPWPALMREPARQIWPVQPA